MERPRHEFWALEGGAPPRSTGPTESPADSPRARERVWRSGGRSARWLARGSDLAKALQGPRGGLSMWFSVDIAAALTSRCDAPRHTRRWACAAGDTGDR